MVVRVISIFAERAHKVVGRLEMFPDCTVGESTTGGKANVVVGPSVVLRPQFSGAIQAERRCILPRFPFDDGVVNPSFPSMEQECSHICKVTSPQIYLPIAKPEDTISRVVESPSPGQNSQTIRRSPSHGLGLAGRDECNCPLPYVVRPDGVVMENVQESAHESDGLQEFRVDNLRVVHAAYHPATQLLFVAQEGPGKSLPEVVQLFFIQRDSLGSVQKGGCCSRKQHANLVCNTQWQPSQPFSRELGLDDPSILHLSWCNSSQRPSRSDHEQPENGAGR